MPNLSFVCEYSKCDTVFIPQRSNIKYCSQTCYRNAKKQRYRAKKGWVPTSVYTSRRKAELVKCAGGACQLCGYNICLAALEFHHLNPAVKPDRRGIVLLPLEEAQEQIKECALLCANCHREVEAGVTELVVVN